jgi:hypothetical protein
VNATTIEITLELELDGETVSGRAKSANGEVREFSGWIGLMGLVDSLLEGARNGALPANQTTEEKNGDAKQD